MNRPLYRIPLEMCLESNNKLLQLRMSGTTEMETQFFSVPHTSKSGFLFFYKCELPELYATTQFFSIFFLSLSLSICHVEFKRFNVFDIKGLV